MAKPIVLYDMNHERVGETYPRRAKQLLRSGRARWLEEGSTMLLDTTHGYQSSLRAEEDFIMNETIYTNHGVEVEKAPEPTGHIGRESSNDLLMHIAKENVARRRGFFRHLVAYLLVWPVITLIFGNVIFIYSSDDVAPTANVALSIEEWGGLPIRQFDFRLSADVPYIIVENVHPQAQTASGSSLLWHFLLGLMTAWGIWIAVRGVSLFRKHSQSRATRRRIDPVDAEYQRLMAMGADA